MSAVEELAKAAAELAALERRVSDLVARARADGASWADVGRALGTTRQGAHKRYGRSGDPTPAGEER